MPLLRNLGLLALAGLAFVPALALDQIYRCGNEYTNDARQAQQRGCPVIEAVPVTVPGTQVMRQAAAPVSVDRRSPPVTEQPRSPGSETRVDALQQRNRDADARLILEAELRKSQTRLAQVQAEFRQGEPEKQGIESRNHQRYLDRVQALREEVVRQQGDVASLQRELARLPAASTVASSP